jgi:(1->4)-alpha-D-glucan 1-alpha-D-glucosylmutase
VRVPTSTYRVQLHAGFTFADATRLVPYLDRLGITDLYCSPILEARPGSVHGYDAVSHDRLNAELDDPRRRPRGHATVRRRRARRRRDRQLRPRASIVSRACT